MFVTIDLVHEAPAFWSQLPGHGSEVGSNVSSGNVEQSGHGHEAAPSCMLPRQ